MEKQKKIRPLITGVQTIFLTTKLFLRNKLLSYAGACSFSFLFSVIPVFMLIILILVQILHASQETIRTFIESIPEIQQYFSTEYAIKALQGFGFFNVHQIVLVFFILWMARRAFASILDSFLAIFHRQVTRKAVITQIATFFIEVLTICVTAGLIFTYGSLRAVSKIPLLDKFPAVLQILNKVLSMWSFNYLPYLLLFAIINVVFRTAPGTHPAKKLCAFSGILCTLSFCVLHKIMHLFLNTKRYSMIYGVLDQVIITFMDIFFFFVIFLYFAQFVYALQFFEDVLITELYLMPKKQDNSFISKIIKKIMIQPDFFIRHNMEIIRLSNGDIVYAPGSNDNDVYIVLSGEIERKAEDSNESEILTKSCFFGDVECLLSVPKRKLTKAKGDAQIARISSKTFHRIAKRTPEISENILSQFQKYIARPVR